MLNWIIGTQEPVADAAAEASAQLDELLEAFKTDRELSNAEHTLPARGQWIVSAHRTFEHQEKIWVRKFEFRGVAFDRVSDAARAICGELIEPSEIQWDPAIPRHRTCWRAPSLPDSPNPPLPSSTRSLTVDERQREILQASAAPGVSRHHWGTDFDLFDRKLDPTHWEEGGRFWPAYSWLRNQGWRYGFLDPFRGVLPLGAGHMVERWHWSYWPVAQPLLEFALVHELDLERALNAHWGEQPHFSFIKQRWRDYLTRVRTRFDPGS